MSAEWQREFELESFDYSMIMGLSIAVLFLGIIILVIKNIILIGNRKHPTMGYFGIFLSGLGFLGIWGSTLLTLTLRGEISFLIVVSCFVVIVGLIIFGLWAYLRRK